MKTLIILTYFLFFCGFLTKSQNIVTRALDPFTQIEIKNGILLQLVKADKGSAEITTQELSSGQVITEIKDGLLLIRLDKVPLTKSKVSIKLFYKDLYSIKASGRSEISSSGLIKQDSLSLDMLSGAQAYLDLDIKYLKSSAVEGALITAEGYAVKHESSISTGATLSLYEVESDEIVIKVSANGKAKINVAKSLTADVSTGGYISYKGDPAIKNINTSIGGKVEQYTE